ncbi:MBL fold metallo-hydrolase [bacterium 1XD42-8]|jgi:competence protein ComEC|nr:MBL fold metallo-hydrolase [Lachnospiraceae bacterium]RKJ51432.1 MBL fold metallo-hydrolase [bacterium 1XD42-8]
MKKRAGILFFFLLFIISCTRNAHSLEDSMVQITFFDIGKADSFLLQTKNSNVLIDTGEEKDGIEIAKYMHENNIQRLDYLIITHFDKDHVGGAPIILEQFQVEQVIHTYASKTSSHYEKYLEALSKQTISPLILEDPLSFSLNSVQFKILPPGKTSYEEKESNNSSLVVLVSNKNTSFLFTGDSYEERIDELLSLDLPQCQVLKLPYHGKFIPNLPDLLEKINPQYGIITCSKKNPPSEETIALLNEKGIKIYLTEEGDIVSISTGENVTMEQIPLLSN